MTAKPDLGDHAVKALTRPGAGTALLAALGVYVVIVLQSLLSTFVYVFTGYAQDFAGYLGLIVRSSLPLALGAPIPFAIGVFLAFWQIAPVAPQLRMAHVVTRSLLAAVIGAVIAAILGIVVALGLNLAHTNPGLVASSGPSTFVANVVDVLRSVLPGTFTMFVNGLVIVPLAGVLLWGWLQSHPPKTAPRGALDEV